MKKTELKGNVKVFSVDCNVNDTSNILDVDKQLTKKYMI